jgi:hypothetical protein
MPRFSIEGALGIAAGIILFVLDKVGIGGTLTYLLLFIIAAVLCIHSVARSDWDSGKRRMGAGGVVLVFYLLFGLWIFARPHKSEHVTGEQRATDSTNHGQSTETGKPNFTERGTDDPLSRRN